MASNPLKPHQTTLLAATLASGVGFAVPILQLLLLPLLYLNTHIHEFWHAFVAVATGGEARYILVFANGSGVTPVAGSSIYLTASAGYVGASLTGAAILMLSRTSERAKLTLKVLAVLLAASLLIWVRGDAVGLGSGIAWAALLWLFGAYLKGANAMFVAQFVGVQQCLNSLRSVYDLMQISAYTDSHSDAKLMEQATLGIPALLWAFAWAAFSLILIVLSLRKAWSAAPDRVG